MSSLNAVVELWHTIDLDADEHPIESVTVYKANKAQVVRIFELFLEVSTCGALNRQLMMYLSGGQTKYRFAVFLIQSTLNSPVSPVLVMPNYSTLFAPSALTSRRSTARVPPKKFASNAKRSTLERDLGDITGISEIMVDQSKSLSGDSVPPP